MVEQIKLQKTPILSLFKINILHGKEIAWFKGLNVCMYGRLKKKHFYPDTWFKDNPSPNQLTNLHVCIDILVNIFLSMSWVKLIISGLQKSGAGNDPFSSRNTVMCLVVCVVRRCDLEIINLKKQKTLETFFACYWERVTNWYI